MKDNRERENPDHKRQRGQGLVEFALITPVLLMTLMGIADFGRMFAIYSNLFNAAREGARYGVVNPSDEYGIELAALGNVTIIDSSGVNVSVEFDSGPGTPTKDPSLVSIGDRVVVILEADVEMITPLIRVFAPQLYVETVATRTISTLGEIGAGGIPPAPPTSTPYGADTPTPTATEPGGGATATPTSTPDPAVTTTPVPPKALIRIDYPLWDGDTVVTGTAEPNETIFIRDIQDPTLNQSIVVNADGTFTFNLTPAGRSLIAGHVIAVQGYGRIDYAVVEGVIAPTATPTPTSTPTPTPTPSHQFIDLAPTCGPDGSITITVTGQQWPTNQQNLEFYWDGVKVKEITKVASFSTDLTVTAAPGLHTVTVQTIKNPGTYNDSKTYEAPCPIIPTPTPSQPNLVVESITLENQGTLSTFDPLTFTVSVRNIGAAAANSLFWVDLYADPASPSDLASEVSVAWAAVSSLPQDQAIDLTLNYLQGFETTDQHQTYAMADSWEQVQETDELDNVGGPLAVYVAQEGTPPVPTPSPTPGGPTGMISGSTWLYINGDVVPQGRVNVYCYDGGLLVAEALSDQDGNYIMLNVPAGSYTIIGETFIDHMLYSDIVMDVEVLGGQTTQYVTLVLH